MWPAIGEGSGVCLACVIKWRKDKTHACVRKELVSGHACVRKELVHNHTCVREELVSAIIV